MSVSIRGQRMRWKVGRDLVRECSDETTPESRTTVAKCIVRRVGRVRAIVKSSKMPLSSDTRNASLVLSGHGKDTRRMALWPSVGLSCMVLMVDLSRRHKSVDVMTSLQCGRCPQK